ncbi:MAG: MMPL family transporter [Candidatus Binatia bacterium]
MLDLPTRWPRATLLLVALVTAVLGAFAVRVRVDSAVDQLLPEGDADGTYYEGVRRDFGSEEVVVVGVFADDVFAPATLARIDRLSTALAHLPEVEEVTSLTTAQRIQLDADGLRRAPLVPARPRSAAEVAALRDRVLDDPVARGTLAARDGRAAGIWVRFRPMRDEQFLAGGSEERLRAALAGVPGPEALAVTGLPTIKVQAARDMVRDLALFVPLGLLLVTVMVVWAFRTWRGVLLPLATVIVGLLCTVGIMVAAGDAFTLGTLVLPPLLMAAGIAYAIHVVSRYYIELRHHPDDADPLATALGHVRLPVAMAALTTFIGFGTFVTSPIPSIRDFGVYAGLGIAAIFVACLAVLPAALTLLPRPRAVPARLDDGGWFSRFVEACGTRSLRHRRAFLLVFVALMGLGAWGITRIRVETDYLRFFRADHPALRENQAIASALVGTQVVTVVVDGTGPGGATRAPVLEAIRDLQRFAARQPGVDQTLSLVDHLESVRRAVAPERVEQPFAAQDEVDQLLLLLAPPDIRHELTADQSRAAITVYTHLSGSQAIGALVERLQAHAAARLPADATARATGTAVLLNRSADALAWSQVWGDAQVMAILLVVMVALLRSARLGLLSMVPNVIPIVLLLGIMGWAGIDLNICTSTIASISIGIAVDDTIHYMLGYHEALRAGATREAAILSTLRAVGRPILITSVALTAGFLLCCLSTFQPVRHFGVLASATMVIGVFTDLFLLPALLITLHVGEPIRHAARQAISEESLP